jgi:penicillin-insensitive murein endopeptidase
VNRLFVIMFLILAQPVAAEPLAAKLFAAQTQPTSGAAQPIGAYGRGCAAGNVELPQTGPTWQAMRLSRNRNWGNPALVSYLEDLSLAVTKFGWKGLYIGDMGNPRGGLQNLAVRRVPVVIDAQLVVGADRDRRDLLAVRR